MERLQQRQGVKKGGAVDADADAGCERPVMRHAPNRDKVEKDKGAAACKVCVYTCTHMCVFRVDMCTY